MRDDRPGRVGHHYQDDVSHGNGLVAGAYCGVGATDFDWESVEDPVGELVEDVPGMTPEVAASVIEWIKLRSGIRSHQRSATHDEARLLLRVLRWIDGARPDMRVRGRDGRVDLDRNGKGETRVGIRAEVAIRELVKGSEASSLSLRELSVLFGTTHQNIHRIQNSFRSEFLRK